MAGNWSFQFWNGSAWATLANVSLDHVLEELNGNEEVVFNLPNTAANRAIIASNVPVNVLYNCTVIYAGLLTGAQYTSANLQCYVYNPVFVALKQAPQNLTKTYTSIAANLILTDIAALTIGVSVGDCPTTPVSIKFTNAQAFDAMTSLTKALGLYYWGVSADCGSFDGTINIGTRDTTAYTPTIYETTTKRGIDRSKQYGTVIIKGVDVNGVQIQGQAGSSGAVKTFTDTKVADVATLNTLAAYKLLTLNNPSTGNPLSILTDTAAAWHPGQYVNVSRSDLNLVGSFIIQRITKQPVLSTIEVDVPVLQDDVNLQDTDQYADLVEYQVQPTTQTPSALTLQGLLDLYHLIDGSGTTAADSTPNGSPNNGTITGGSWVNGHIPGTKALTFAGAGYVDCTSNVNLGGQSAFAVGGWFSPFAYGTDQNYLIAKDSQFILQQFGTSGQVRFGVHIGGNWIFLMSAAQDAPLNQLVFAIAVYDGSNMWLYVNDPSGANQLLTYSQTQTGTLDASTNDVYLASKTSSAGGLNGGLAECMIWGRALSAQEVQELFFQPLTTVVAKTAVNPNLNLVAANMEAISLGW